MRQVVIEQLTGPGGGSPLQVATIARAVGEDIITGSVLSVEQGAFTIRAGILDLLPFGAGTLSPAQSSNLLSPVARFYESPWRVNTLTWFSGQPLPFEREKLIWDRMLPAPKEGLWLDLAASTALYGRWLAPQLLEAKGEVISLDYSFPMLRRAQKMIRREGHINISLVCARGERLPFANGSLSGVVCGGSLNEFGAENIPRILREVTRVLKPGAPALFMHLLKAEATVGKLVQTVVAVPAGIQFWDRDESDALFTAAGLSVEERRDFGNVAFTRLRKDAS